MQKKLFPITPKGMQQDIQPQGIPENFAYELKNIRINGDKEGTALALVNERGNSLQNFHVVGNIIGVQTLSDYVILFTHSDTEETYKDRIYKYTYYDDGNLRFKWCLKGDLNFINRIKSTGIIETENIHKIYWVDGVNPPRVLNVVKYDNLYKSEDIVISDNSTFNFIPNFTPGATFYITKNLSGGEFQPGVIQYALVYYNKNGQQTNIVAVSPLQYLSYKNGVIADKTCNCSFNVTIENVDTSFDFARIYSIIRTTENADVAIKRVADIQINSSTIKCIDTNTTGDTEDPYALLFMGIQNFSAAQITQKDNTLFLGDIKTNQYSVFKDNEGNPIVWRESQKKIIDANIDANIDSIIKSVSKSSWEDWDYHNYTGELDKGADKITTFKGGETYRLGIQFQFKNGSFSDPYYINDVKNNFYPSLYYNIGNHRIQLKLSYAHVSFIPKTLNLSSDIIGARLMMVMPTSLDRTVVCQGAICPTMYNLYKRCTVGPFAQSSWIWRSPGRHNIELPTAEQIGDAEIQSLYLPCRGPFMFDNSTKLKIVIRTGSSDAGVYGFDSFSFDVYNVTNFQEELLNTYNNSYYSNIIKSLKLYLDVEDIPSETEWIALHNNHDSIIKILTRNNSIINYLATRNSSYYQDDSIITFHSPDIEDAYHQIHNANNVNFRIIGVFFCKDYDSSYEIKSTTPQTPGYKGELYKQVNNLKSALLWNDKSIDPTFDTQIRSEGVNFATYMWHGPTLSDSVNTSAEDGTQTSLLKNKTFANIRQVSEVYYFSNPWTPNNGIVLPQVFNSNELSLARLPNPANSNLAGSLCYFGNVDQICDSLYNVYGKRLDSNGQEVEALEAYGERWKKEEDPYYKKDTLKYVNSPIRISYKSTPHAIIAFNYTDAGFQIVLPKTTVTDSENNSYTFGQEDYGNNHNGINFYEQFKQGTPIWEKDPYKYKTVEKWFSKFSDLGSYSNFIDKYIYIEDYDSGGIPNEERSNSLYIIVQEKISDNNYTLSLEKVPPDNARWVLYKDSKDNVINAVYTYTEKGLINPTWEGISQNTLYLSASDDFSKLAHSEIIYLAELYREVLNQYGGRVIDDEGTINYEVLEQNQWIPIGDIHPINVNSNTVFELTGDRGDTYYQRWDCLKTYPFAEDSLNKVVDITSFMVESRINLDGRYDANRGQLNVINVTPQNFNLINTIYNQADNYFNYYPIDEAVFNFSNQITWSLEKMMGEEVDSWSHITLSNIYDLPGNKGALTSLQVLNNEIYAFQEQTIQRILFNVREAIPVTDGVPIEISNGRKLTGINQISEYGCLDEKSIVNTGEAIVWVDQLHKKLMLLNEKGTADLSTTKGMRSWYNKLTSSPHVFYDSNTDDIYTSTSTECLAYNQWLDAFSSFYSYEGVDWMFTLKGDTFQIKDNVVWKMHSGEYNSYFGVNKPFSIKFIANPEFSEDKVFDTLEFRTGQVEGFHNSYFEPKFSNIDGKLIEAYLPFNKIKVQNEYQYAYKDNSDLKRKFRMWRWPLPRVNGKDRIRNPWTAIEISNDGDKDEAVRLYDMSVHYYI